jgi:type I restriction enzyme, R subunit
VRGMPRENLAVELLRKLLAGEIQTRRKKNVVQAKSFAAMLEEAVAVMLEKYEICCGLFHGFDWSKWLSAKAEERLSLLPAAQEHILKQENGKERLLEVVRDLLRAFALAVPHEESLRIRDDVAFFQAVRAVLTKHAPGERKTQEELDFAVRQIVSRVVAPEGVVDIFAAAGLQKPDISILSDEFLAECAACRSAIWR